MAERADGHRAKMEGEGGRPFIRVEGLEKAFGTQQILKGASLEIQRGQNMVIIGASGEGKSVFLKHIIGLLRADAGRVEVDGEDITSLPERQLNGVRKKVGILFQGGALFDSMSVEENVAFPLKESGVRDRELIARRVHECLEIVELADHKKKMPIHLSGGMRKRVALARAIISEPECVLYDEPTAGLDPVVSDVINHMIRRLQRQLAVTNVVVTHDMKSVYHIADRVAYLRQGRIYFEGTVDELRASEDSVVQNFIEGRSGFSVAGGEGMLG
jgi:phospholipid/cholesterol/gamma-HCH transport system ATP-binding protein